MIGYAICASFCTHKDSLEVLEELTKSYSVLPIMSFNTYSTDTRFGKAEDLIEKVEKLTGNKVVHTIKDAEPLGPKIFLEAIVISPCTGNTLAKLANAITDTPVTMAAKAHLRCNRPIVIALASNDALAGNLKNIATLLNRKDCYFVPMIQDDPERKPHSLVADFSKVSSTLTAALKKEQPRPLFLSNKTNSN